MELRPNLSLPQAHIDSGQIHVHPQRTALEPSHHPEGDTKLKTDVARLQGCSEENLHKLQKTGTVWQSRWPGHFSI
jgi:hypothetical protein